MHPLVAAVNLSPKNLQDADLPERIGSLLKVFGAPASLIDLR